MDKPAQLLASQCYWHSDEIFVNANNCTRKTNMVSTSTHQQTVPEHQHRELTTGSFTISMREIMLGPPRKFSKILISRLIFFFFTGWRVKNKAVGMVGSQHPASSWVWSLYIYLENLHDHLLIIGDVDGLKHFAVLSTSQFSHQLKIILVSVEKNPNISRP